MGIFLDGPVVQGIKVGDIIKAKRTYGYEDGKRPHVELSEYRVTEVTRHTVTGVRDRGRDKRVFSYGDLVINGLQPQYRCSEEAFICDPRLGARHVYNRKEGERHGNRPVCKNQG